MPRKKRRVKIRKRWAIHPATRVKESGKFYSRKRGQKLEQYLEDAERR